MRRAVRGWRSLWGATEVAPPVPVAHVRVRVINGHIRLQMFDAHYDAMVGEQIVDVADGSVVVVRYLVAL